MPNLKVSGDFALSRLYSIPHQSFQDAMESNWKVNGNGHVPAQSVCWLFCWAKTGMGSEDAASAAKNVFDEILDVPYNVFDKRVPHDWARRTRGAQGNRDRQLDEMLGKPGSAAAEDSTHRAPAAKKWDSLWHQTQRAESQTPSGQYVDAARLSALGNVTASSFDLVKLIRLCEELNVCYANECYMATAMLVRAILDHVPPIFSLAKFSEVSSNYNGSRSFKELMEHLQNSCRKIADQHLHTQIRDKETLPTRTQVDFRAELDVLLAEIIRLLK